MSVLFLLIPLSVLIATGFFLAFIWAVRSGQYEDTCTPSLRLLLEDTEPRKEQSNQCISKDEHGNDQIR
jgi:cbb3-type cytochrome oxidase maturation protein